MLITAAQLVVELHELGTHEVTLPRDKVMYCPTVEWLKSFGLWFVKDLGDQQWIAEKFDCDDFAIRAVDRATVALISNANIDSCGHAFCYANVDIYEEDICGISGGGSHAVNFVRCVDGWHYFEPQTGLSTPLGPLRDSLSVVRIYSVWL
jgi:hypothetical protein